ncbi:hypothetical protein FRB99_006039 [Tulasnella sp. 403]|nr:hypothetical protein FRB99_006039 [Tulasnella sp. 403]
MTYPTPDPPSPTISYVSDMDDRRSCAGLHPYSSFSLPSPVFPQRYSYGPPASAATSVKDFDLLPRVKGLYRLLDLYSENTADGLVDKIIISQESLKNFLDTVRPGSYKSLTKIDFHDLDHVSINAIGIYGSKREIVRLLRDTGAVDDGVQRCLLVPHDTTSTIQPHLRSGIYAFIPPNSRQEGGSFNPHAAIYVIYWPEETTWDDDATRTVRKNRVTFMRYLTRLTDQVRALISPEHLSALEWKDVESEWDFSESESDESNDEMNDRFFKFEVAKTNEQEEDVAIREGFKVSHHAISTNSASPFLSDITTRSPSLDPIFLYGETRQALADKKYIPGQMHVETIDSKYTLHHLRAILQKHSNIYLADTVDYKGLEILLEDGNLKGRIPELYRKYMDAMRNIDTSARVLNDTEALRVEYRRLFQEALIAQSTQLPLIISSVAKSNPYTQFVDVRGYCQYQTEAKVQHRLWTLETPGYDMLRLREDQKHQPKPRVLSHPMSTWSLPLTWNLRHIQVFNNRSKKHVLLMIDLPDSVGIWLFPLLDGPLFDKPTKRIPNMKSHRHTLACDEQRRLLAIVISDPDKCICQLFAIDESFTNIQSRGSPFNLLPWNQDGIPKITAAAFFAGTEELCLLEENGRVRVFSFLAQSFRLGTIRLNPGVRHIQASPDGTALVAIEQDQHGKKLRLFHLASFGHKDTGITTALPEEFNSATSFTLTSIGDRRNVFLMALSPSLQCIHSVALDISRKETEYQFRAKAERAQSTVSVPTVHNALMDCFSEVWSRYPVVAAVQRETFAGSRRLPPSITFVSEDPDRPFRPYFKQMVRDFEQLAKKPTEKRLDKIVIEAARFEELEWEAPVSSTYRAGEWLAELLCLIPIHIALARENRFVPLKDGILDPALERQLLGAEVANIIDAITVGWYESIFSSYMATKPVKVVSSMGEQSVGKSYSLNHLVDSSFAASAVRTTEGVWLSVCPTKDVLVVALEFEGVHSIERTAQEDMLLVLFNTALSNLVLFRNNFALSRDVANMFTSFQASTHLFDPASNPKLFKGLLAIVIKDVVDSDKKEIVKEFSSKFSQIVSTEQADNFITVLHDSQLTVIPWNVIQSREFYTLFSKLSKHLFKQQTTHATAGEFLITLKTLMAKLKAQDWGSIDQTVIKHRVTALTAILPNAFAIGHAEIDPAVEPLKNLDNQEPIMVMDSEAVFYVGKEPQDIDRALFAHLQNWKRDAARHSVEELQEHLKETANLRLAHVKVWFDVNTARFPADNADIRGLRRLFDDTSAALLSNVQLCLGDVTGAGRPIIAKHLAIIAMSTLIQSIADYRPVTLVAMYAKWLPIYAENPVPLTRKKAVKVVVRSPAIMKMANTFVRPEPTNAECDATYKQSSHRMAKPTIVPVGAPSHSHLQAEHDTAHGSMEHTSWVIEGATGVTIEVQGRKFSSQDNGALQLCSSVCRNLGRHAHIDYCRNMKGQCQEPESEHIKERMLPNPDRPKDWVSHKVFWARTGFRDPYSNVEQAEFGLCDVQCAGAEHNATASAPARPSYCTLPIFHPPQPSNWQVAGNDSYVSADGHSFNCPNPNNIRQAYHIIFVLDKSESMGCRDRRPLPNQPVTQLITNNNNNRFGAALSSLYEFWVSRGSGATGGRRDAYSVITFDSGVQTQFANDFNSNADQLLCRVTGIRTGGGADFDGALRATQAVMENNWSTDR